MICASFLAEDFLTGTPSTPWDLDYIAFNTNYVECNMIHVKLCVEFNTNYLECRSTRSDAGTHYLNSNMKHVAFEINRVELC